MQIFIVLLPLSDGRQMRGRGAPAKPRGCCSAPEHREQLLGKDLPGKPPPKKGEKMKGVRGEKPTPGSWPPATAATGVDDARWDPSNWDFPTLGPPAPGWSPQYRG